MAQAPPSVTAGNTSATAAGTTAAQPCPHQHACVHVRAYIHPRRTALAEAALNGQEGIVRLLLAFGANPRATDNDGATPLHHACRAWQGQEGCIVALLSAGVPINAVDRCGCTPLHAAARAGNSLAVHTLLGAGADAAWADASGETALAAALCAGHQGAVEMLLLVEEEDDKSIPSSSKSIQTSIQSGIHLASRSMRSSVSLQQPGTPAVPAGGWGPGAGSSEGWRQDSIPAGAAYVCAARSMDEAGALLLLA